ncbi:MAG TPA: DUF2786 domain-containing protein [Euzebyales bacterium]|nr:DUF2786 domain-containing protein [Euzebyales bacterium]
MRAAALSWQRDPQGHERLLDDLDALADRGQPVLATVRRMLGAELPRLWRHGWTPIDVVHITTRRLSAAHAVAVAEVIVSDGHARIRAGQALHPRWRAQLDIVETRRAARGGGRAHDAVRHAVTVLALITHLSPVPPTVPAPDAPESALSGVEGLDRRMLARVRALLAKAESTEFEEEAEALTAKAQELITRHTIAEALLHTPDDVGEPVVRRIHLDDPYVEAKAQLLANIADANRCSTVYEPFGGWSTVFGYDRDLDAVELLAASLLAQATSAMARHGSRHDVHGRSTTRSFRRSFLFGFGMRVGERLRTASDGQVSATTAADRQQLLPVLAARDARVRAAQEATFPSAVHRSTSISNAMGWFAGQAAADQADLDVSAGRLRP